MARRASGPVEDNRGQRWLGTIGGKREHLAYYREGVDRAWEVFHARTTEHNKKVKANPSGRATAKGVFDCFLDHVEREQSGLSYETHKRMLSKFVAHVGPELAAEELKPLHVTEWFGKRSWASTTRAIAVASIKCALSWGARQGYIDRNPLASLQRPTSARRTAIMTDEQFRRVYDARSDERFGDLMIGLRETGARPSEIMRLEASMIDFAEGVAVMSSKTTGRTGRKRVIYLSPAAMAICERLAREFPTGPIFRNAAGVPWTRNVMGWRFRKLRRKLGMGPEVTAESMRHMFATDALEREVPIATVAQLMGHSGTAMISRNYSHLDKRQDHLKAALQRVRPGEATGA